MNVSHGNLDIPTVDRLRTHDGRLPGESAMTGVGSGSWLRAVRPVLDPADHVDWEQLHALESALDQALTAHPIDIPAGAERARRLQAVRRVMVERGFLVTRSHPALYAVLAQFVCGYRDIDLRDAVTLGHAELIDEHGHPAIRRRWVRRAAAGELAGVAITEPHGGSRPAASRTRARTGPGGTWLISGRKKWISRLTEASVFVVFFQDPNGSLAAAVIDADAPGIHRQPIAPTGVAGWTWGILDLDDVSISPQRDVLRGDGMHLLRNHFASYRSLVTATGIGAAAAVFDIVTAALTDRQDSGDVPRLRDSALVTIGRTHAQLVTALLGTAMAAQLAQAGNDRAEQWGWEMKAHGIDTAHHAAAELGLLLGAAAYQAESPIAKIRRDLEGLLIADGIHDSLYRSAGVRHTTRLSAVSEPWQQPLAMPV